MTDENRRTSFDRNAALYDAVRPGYRPVLRDRLEIRVGEILDDARTGWAQPEIRAPLAASR